MIEVSHLTKKYGNHVAVSDLSFSIQKGTVYGFLGPNGAGKSTTMNIMTGCLGATEGEVTIDGHSVFEEPMVAKKLVGYLPEQPPLYMDMTPKEYLRFVASAKGLRGAELTEQMNQVMERTRITDVQDRLIKNLSKGYKQRVGIAQALLGNPAVIILDEPTVGLDPKQIIEIRELIRDLGKTHTVVLSSHVLSEVQAVCDSIMIISHGKLVACDTAENLTALFAGNATIRLEARLSQKEMRDVLSRVPGLGELSFSEDEHDQATVCSFNALKERDVRGEIFTAFASAGKTLLEMTTVKASLEDVFLELTAAEAEETATAPEEDEASEKETDSSDKKGEEQA